MILGGGVGRCLKGRKGRALTERFPYVSSLDPHSDPEILDIRWSGLKDEQDDNSVFSL